MEDPIVGLEETKTIVYPCWRDDSPKYFSLSEILGNFAMWTIRQSPYVCPENLDSAIEALSLKLKGVIEFDKFGYAELSCRDIRTKLETIFEEIPWIMDWNEKKVDGDNTFSESHPDWNPDYDFIDLDALARNVSHSMIVECLVHA